MSDNKNKEVLEIGVDAKGAISDFDKFERSLTEAMKGISDAVAAMGKKNEDVTKQAQKDTKLWTDNLDDLKKAYKAEGAEITKMEALMTALSKKANKASEEEVAGYMEQINQIKKMRSEKAKGLKARAATDEKFSKGTKEVREEVKEAFKAFFHKDFKKSAEAGMRSLVKSLKLTATGGEKFRNKGMELQNRGSVKGGFSGKAMSAAGSALKGVGAGAGKVGELVQGLSKLGPVLGMIGSAVMGIVALFLDLDGKSKAFNADIMKSASNVEFLAASGGDVDDAFSHVKSTLTGIRKAAISFDNIKWGISPEEHAQIVNVLNQEGVSLQTIERSAVDAAKANRTYTDSFEGNTKAVEAFQTELAHVTVAYSRAFGVPLQEINQLQGEMFKEMGISLENTGKAFEEMTREANASGIASNSFFAMIRGVSSDLSLWTTRMDSAVKLLGKLGTVMSPRNAGKFMATLVQGFKGKGPTELVQNTLLVGTAAMKKLNAQSIRKAEATLSGFLGVSSKELNAMSDDAIEEAVQKMDPKKRGEARDALYQRKIMKSENSGGTFGAAMASGSQSPAEVAETMIKKLLSLTGKKSITSALTGGDSSRLALMMSAQNQGVSNEDVLNFGKLEQSAELQRKFLKKKLTSDSMQDRQEATEALKKSGIEAADTQDLIKKVNEAGIADLIDTQTEDQKDQPDKTDQQKILEAAVQQNTLTQSWQKKFDMLVDWAMGSLFQLLLDMWDTLTKIPGVGGGGAAHELKKNVMLMKAPELTKALEDAGDDMGKFKGNLFKQGSGFSENLLAALKGDKKGETESSIGAAFMNVEDQLSAVKSAGKAVGLDDKTIEALSKGMGSDGGTKGSLSENMKGTDLSGDQRAAFMHQMAGMLNPNDLPVLFKKVMPSASAGAPAPAQQAPSPAAPAATAAKAAETATDTLSYSKEQAQTMQSIDNQMDKFKMDTGFLSGPYSKAVETSVLAAVRTALFEYYMYKDLNQKDVASTLGATGMSGRAFSQGIGETAGRGYNADVALESMKPHASGGMVTGIANGMAVTAAAGEGLASIGKGERIIPRGAGTGGGTGPITVNVNGVGGDDLAKVIQAKVIDGIYEYKRRERFTP